MQAIIKKWGNSASVRIPAPLMKAVELDIDSTVEIKEEDGRLVIEPLNETINLDSLVSGITPENLHREFSFGNPVGKEAL